MFYAFACYILMLYLINTRIYRIIDRRDEPITAASLYVGPAHWSDARVYISHRSALRRPFPLTDIAVFEVLGSSHEAKAFESGD